MADISEYTDAQQKVIKGIIANDNGFHKDYLIADQPFYGMLDELDNGTLNVKDNVSSTLSVGSLEYELQIFYSKEQNCWFYKLTYGEEEIRGIIHYNTLYNPMGEIAFSILNDNTDDTNLSASLPYSNVLILRR